MNLEPDLGPEADTMNDQKQNRPATDPQPLLLKNANVLDYLPVAMDAAPAPKVARADLRIAGGRIVERGTDLAPAKGETLIDVTAYSLWDGSVSCRPSGWPAQNI